MLPRSTADTARFLTELVWVVELRYAPVNSVPMPGSASRVVAVSAVPLTVISAVRPPGRYEIATRYEPSSAGRTNADRETTRVPFWNTWTPPFDLTRMPRATSGFVTYPLA